MADAVREMGAKCRNWSKWGPNDELGTLNYITPETIVAATRRVRRGVTFSLAIPFDNTGPQINQPRRFNPIHRMILTGPDFTTGAFKRPGGVGFADDMVIMALQCGTQWDALSHCFLDGRLYNGYDANLVSSEGAKKNGMEKMARFIATRGVLLDLPRAKGVDWLEPGYAITVDDLEAAAKAHSVTVGRGDALPVRPGRMSMCRARGGWGVYAGAAQGRLPSPDQQGVAPADRDGVRLGRRLQIVHRDSVARLEPVDALRARQVEQHAPGGDEARHVLHAVLLGALARDEIGVVAVVEAAVQEAV